MSTLRQGVEYGQVYENACGQVYMSALRERKEKMKKITRTRIRNAAIVITLVLWPTLMSAARGYHDAGTVFGDVMVAGLGIVGAPCVISCLRKDKAMHEEIEIQHEEIEFRKAQ